MRDIETGLSRRMGYVSFKESKAVDIAIDEMHETVNPTTSLHFPPAPLPGPSAFAVSHAAVAAITTAQRPLRPLPSPSSRLVSHSHMHTPRAATAGRPEPHLATLQPLQRTHAPLNRGRGRRGAARRARACASARFWLGC